MLFVVPPLFILAGWARGTRPADRPIVTAIAVVCAVGFVPAILIGVESRDLLAQAAAYAFAVLSTTCLAMRLHTRPGPDDGGEEEPENPVPGGPDLVPFDWDDFERRFWADVERRRRRPRAPVA
jgi:hypothetical protein